jgi:hypothetical protein
VRGIIVCVDYDDLLEITLVRNARHLTEILVVTAPHDERTKAVVSRVPSVRLFETDAFYRNGAKFNKGAAMEEGFDVLGREGWILILDADILLPDVLPIPKLRPDCLYSASRVMLDDPRQWTPDFDWSRAARTRESTFAGYFQLFHTSDPHLVRRPWYDTTFNHAGGGDEVFQSHWSRKHKIRLPFDVLHLGPRDTNWFGRASCRADGGPSPENAAERLAEMRQYRRTQGWDGGP